MAKERSPRSAAAILLAGRHAIQRFRLHLFVRSLAIALCLVIGVAASAGSYAAHHGAGGPIQLEHQPPAIEGLRPPRYLKNPERKILGPDSSVVFWRTTDDTCGLYTWGEFDVAPGQGAPPHLHYGDEEWFIPTQSGPIRMYGAKQSPKTYKIGQLPGFNTEPEAMGSTVIDKGSVLYSPRGNIHYFTNESGGSVKGFLNIWAPGFGVRKMFDSFGVVNFRFASKTSHSGFGASNQLALIEKTGLWGVPHDASGRMVGRRDFAAIRGDLVIHPNHLGHLQELIDAGEACYPKDGIRPTGSARRLTPPEAVTAPGH